MSLLAATLLTAMPAAPAPAQDKELLSFWVADLETFFGDPKDAGLLRALKLVDDRVLELPDEIPGFQIPVPPEVVRLGLHLFTGEKSLRILQSSDPNMMLPVYGQLELMEGDPAKAKEFAGMLVQLAQDAGAPIGEPREDGMVPIEGVPVPILFGARGSEVVLSAGKVIGTPIDLSNTGLPQGVRPTMAGHIDLGGILSMARPFASMDPDGAMIFGLLEQVGLMELDIQMASGVDDDRSYSHISMPGFAGAVRDRGMMPARGLNARDLQMVPQDASFASVSTVNFQGSLDFVLGLIAAPLAEEGIEDPIGMLAGMTGLNLRTDLVDHLGSVWGLYAADTTGGGGLLSCVMFIELANPDGLLDTTERMQDILNGIADEQAMGYVELRTWEQGGTEYLTLTFPGLPIPAEPTVAFTDHYLIATLTPTACMAAVAQAKGEGPSLLDNPRFKENLPGNVDGAYGVSFYDTPRMIADGYGLTSLLCSALTNGTRSRTDATRDAGIIMPSYHELMRGAKASVGLTRVVGDDFVSDYRGDRSVLVNLTSTVGFIAGSPITLLIPAAMLMAVRQGGMNPTPDWQELGHDH
jgi:hypothetical protein